MTAAIVLYPERVVQKDRDTLVKNLNQKIVNADFN